MKILISGVSSFIGYNLSVYLSENYKIIGTLSKNFNDYRGIRYKRLRDLRKNKVNLLKFNFSQKEIKNIFHKYKPDYIILNHAVTDNATNINFDFEKSMNVNLKGMRLLFEYAKKYKVKKVILTSTNQEYYLTARVLTEKSKYTPQSPYGLSKYIQSSISRIYSNHYGVNCISTKIFNPFGKLDNPKKLIPHVINNLVNNKVTDLSKCLQKRDFIGIEDICYAYKKILLIDQKDFYMDINVTTDNSTYTSRARNQQGDRSGNHTNVALSTETLVDVTDTSQVKVKIGYGSLNNNNTLVGDTDQNRTFFTFIRLGDT